MSSSEDDRVQGLHEAILALLSRALERSTRFPQNGYRRRQYFEGMATIASDVDLLSRAAAALIRIAGSDLQI